MSGLARVFFAVSATALRWLAWLPFIAADKLHALANWCEARATETATGIEP